MTKPLNELSISEAARALRSKACTVQELWDACSSAAQTRNKELNAYLEIFAPDAGAIEAAQKRIDEILDKINLKGYRFLTDEEKEILRRASEDDNI